MRRVDALWGPLAIATDVFRSTTKYPRELALGLAVLPALWGLPLIFVSKYTDEPHPDSRLAAASVASYLVLVMIRSAWSAVLQGGTVRIALTATDGARPDLRDLVRGVSLWAPMFVMQLALTLGSIFRHFVPAGPTRHLATSSVVSILGFYLVLRASLWQTIVVDKRCSVVAAFIQSWRYTHGRVWRLLLFHALPFLPFMVLGYAGALRGWFGASAKGLQEIASTLGFKLAFGGLFPLVLGPYFTLGMARIYRIEEGTPYEPPEDRPKQPREPRRIVRTLLDRAPFECFECKSRVSFGASRCGACGARYSYQPDGAVTCEIEVSSER